MNIARTIDGREAIPLRALPFVTGGLIDGSTIAAILVEQGARSLWPKLDTFVADGFGNKSEVPSHYFVRMQAEMALSATGDVLAKRQRIPPGVLIWADEAEQAFSQLARDLVGSRYRDEESWSPPAVGAWMISPPLNSTEYDFIMEGMDRPTSPSVRHQRGKRLENGARPDWKALAIKHAQDLKDHRRGRTPTREDVAKSMAKELGMNPSTVERAIRAAWYK